VEFGYAHSGLKPGDGDLAYFCAACPQAGINIPADWEDDPEQWKFQVGLAADGNFSQVHQNSKGGGKDIWLKSGESFMVERTKYKHHLNQAVEIYTVSKSCSCILTCINGSLRDPLATIITLLVTEAKD